MRIVIKQPGMIPVFIALPTGVLTSRLCASLVLTALRQGKTEEMSQIGEADIRRLMNAVRDVAAVHPGFVLVDVEAQDGTTVKVKL